MFIKKTRAINNTTTHKMSVNVKSVSEFLNSLENEKKIAAQISNANDKKEGETFAPNLLDPSYNTPECQGINGAKCPTCENVEIRFLVTKYIPQSTMRIIVTYAGSGYDLECLACRTKFHFCGNRGMFGTYELDNYVFVPRSWATEKLGIE